MRATGHPALDRLDHAVDRAFQCRKRTNRRRDRLGDAVEPHRHLGDDAERALGADEQPGQIIARRRFAGPARGAHDPAVGQHHGQAQHILAHRAVAHRVGAGGAGRRHAAERGVGARIDRKEQPGVAQMLVQLLAGHPGLDRGVEILGADPHDPVHLGHVDGDAAGQRRDLALERGAGAKGDDRRLVRGAELDDRRDLVGGVREGDRIGRVRGMIGFVPAVLGADRRRDRKPLAQKLAQRRQQ